MLHYSTYIIDDSVEWVTFIHGAGGSSSIWYKQLRDFKKDYNVLLIDLRGHGKSKNKTYEQLRNYTFDIISDEVIDVLDFLKIKQTHFVGISLGSLIIRNFANLYPERVTSCVLGGMITKINFFSKVLLFYVLKLS